MRFAFKPVRPVLQAVTGLALLLWPVLICAGWYFECLQEMLYVLIPLLLLRLCLLGRTGALRALLLPGVALALLLSLAALYLRTAELLRYYPVAVSAALLLVFGGSLFTRQCLVERLARLQEPDLPVEALPYVRKVTVVWCLFFLINGSVALYTAVCCSWQVWTLYNGCLSYLFMGSLMGGEYLIRRRVRRQYERS